MNFDIIEFEKTVIICNKKSKAAVQKSKLRLLLKILPLKIIQQNLIKRD